MAELDAMITKKLRKSNPALLQVWKQTRHVERRPRKKAPPTSLSVTAMPTAALAAAAPAGGQQAGQFAVAVEPRANGATDHTTGQQRSSANHAV